MGCAHWGGICGGGSGMLTAGIDDSRPAAALAPPMGATDPDPSIPIRGGASTPREAARLPESSAVTRASRVARRVEKPDRYCGRSAGESVGAAAAKARAREGRRRGERQSARAAPRGGGSGRVRGDARAARGGGMACAPAVSSGNSSPSPRTSDSRPHLPPSRLRPSRRPPPTQPCPSRPSTGRRRAWAVAGRAGRALGLCESVRGHRAGRPPSPRVVSQVRRPNTGSR